MADRLFLFQDDDTDTEVTPFRVTPKREVGVEEYGSSFINFYNTTLGLPTLEQETGIEVEEEDITELAEPGRPQKEDDPSRDGADLRNILDQQILGGQEGEFTAASQVSFYNEGVPASGTYFDSYSDYLSSAQDGKFSDRVGLVQNILEPTVTGNFKDIDLGAGFGSEVKATAKDVETGVKEAPSRAERLFTGKLNPEDSKALAQGLVSVTGLAGAAAGTFIGGQPVKNAFGNNSFRPASALGAIADIVHAKQYADMSAIRAAVRAVGINPKVDTGFAMTIGDFGITRAPGSGTYTGNTRGMSHEQIKALEAISGGFDPIRGRYNMLNPSESQTVAESGGMFISGNNMDGFFRANGTFYDPRSGASAAYGRKSDAEKAAATAGISYDEFQNALGVARSGSKTLAAAIQDIKDTKAAAATKARQEREQREAAAAAEQDRRLREEKAAAADAAALAAARRDDGDDNRYGGNEYSFDSGQSFGVGSSIGGGFAGALAEGGRVGLATGGAPGMASGFVDRPPEQVPEDQTVADNRPAQLPEGAFVINAAAVEFAGSNDIKDMLLEAHKEAVRRGLTVDKQGNGAKLIDVAISSGEVVVSPHLAKIIGYDRLTKINNRGKPETRERIEENGQQPVGAAEGGFLSRLFGFGKEEPQLTMPKPDPADVPVNQEPAQQGFVDMPAAEPSTPLPPLTDFENTARDLLIRLEGNTPTGYVPKGKSRSGVTVGIGFDIGQHNPTDLEKMGLNSNLIAKLTPYLKKKGKAARDVLEVAPLQLSESETEEINKIVIRKKYEEFENKFPKYASIPDDGKRAVMFSTAYIGGLNRYKTFRTEFDKAQNLKRAIRVGLFGKMNRGDAEYNRAKKALDWYNEYELENMQRPIPKPNSSATR